MDFIYFIVVALITCMSLNIIFEGINQSTLRLFVPLQNLTRKIKRAKLVKNITILVAIIIQVTLSEYMELTNIWRGIFLGFCVSLIDIIFKTEENNYGLDSKNRKL